MAYKLFIFKDGDIVINKVEILTIPSFTTILRRDKGSVGDNDGRKKLMAFKEFAYIYHVADVNSKPNKAGLNRADARQYAREKADLPEDWKEDSVVKQAIRDYIDESDSLPRRTILELIKTYAFILKAIPKVRRRIEGIIDANEQLTPDQAAEILNATKVLLELGKDIPVQTNKLMSAINDLEKMDEKAKLKLLKGSKEAVPDSAMPDKSW